MTGKSRDANYHDPAASAAAAQDNGPIDSEAEYSSATRDLAKQLTTALRLDYAEEQDHELSLQDHLHPPESFTAKPPVKESEKLEPSVCEDAKCVASASLVPSRPVSAAPENEEFRSTPLRERFADRNSSLGPHDGQTPHVQSNAEGESVTGRGAHWEEENQGLSEARAMSDDAVPLTATQHQATLERQEQNQNMSQHDEKGERPSMTGSSPAEANTVKDLACGSPARMSYSPLASQRPASADAGGAVTMYRPGNPPQPDSSQADEPTQSPAFHLPFQQNMDSLSAFSPTSLSPIPSVSLTEQAASVRRHQIAQSLAESRQSDTQSASLQNAELLYADPSRQASSPQISLPSDKSEALNQAPSFALDPNVQPPPPQQEDGSFGARSHPRRRKDLVTNRTGNSSWQRRISMDRDSQRESSTVKSASSTQVNAAASTDKLTRRIKPEAYQPRQKLQQNGTPSSSKPKKLGRLRRHSMSNALAASEEAPVKKKNGFARLSVCRSLHHLGQVRVVLTIRHRACSIETVYLAQVALTKHRPRVLLIRERRQCLRVTKKNGARYGR